VTDTTPTTSATASNSNGLGAARSRTALPLWIAAISLAVIALVMIIASFQLLNALHSTQASVVQLQQQVTDLKTGLGGLLGG